MMMDEAMDTNSLVAVVKDLTSPLELMVADD